MPIITLFFILHQTAPSHWSRCQRGIPRRGIGRHPRPRGGRISSISDPVNVNGGYFSPIPVPVRGKNPRGDTIPAQTPHNGSSYAQMFISLQPQIQMKKNTYYNSNLPCPSISVDPACSSITRAIGEASHGCRFGIGGHLEL
jgi:hypothetical protein